MATTMTRSQLADDHIEAAERLLFKVDSGCFVDMAEVAAAQSVTAHVMLAEWYSRNEPNRLVEAPQ